MKLETQVKKNTKDISILKTAVKENTSRITSLEEFIVPELKIIGKKIDNFKMPWIQYIGLLAMGSFLTIISILFLFRGSV
jgi:hypothetical protein